jgi:hypothetical protein
VEVVAFIAGMIVMAVAITAQDLWEISHSDEEGLG